MRELYIKVNEILNKIDFNSIWNGFSRFPYALYDKNNVYFQNEVIPYDNRFLGNTSIDYNGEYIAIWNIDNSVKEEPETLAANLVHEMFHALQQQNHESRYPNDLLLFNYPDNEENLLVKYSENLILAKAFLTKDMQEKKAFLMQFISARKYREGLIGDILQQEYLSETIEGMAEYAGSMALKQISMDKYTSMIDKYIVHLQSLDESFFDIRKMLYYSGVIFCIVLSEVGIDFYHTIGTTELPLFCIASSNARAEKPDITFDKAKMSSQITQHRLKNKQSFDDFILSHHDETIEDCFICGYDPMNMIKVNDSILCSNFIMLKNKDCKKPIFIQGPVMVNLKKGSVNEVYSYIK